MNDKVGNRDVHPRSIFSFDSHWMKSLYSNDDRMLDVSFVHPLFIEFYIDLYLRSGPYAYEMDHLRMI